MGSASRNSDKRLEDEWSSVALQTSCSLEPVFQFENDHSLSHSYATLCLPDSKLNQVQLDHGPRDTSSPARANPSLSASTSPQTTESTNPSMSSSHLVSQPPQRMEGAHN